MNINCLECEHIVTFETDKEPLVKLRCRAKKDKGAFQFICFVDKTKAQHVTPPDWCPYR
jgi:hypothetical protein